MGLRYAISQIYSIVAGALREREQANRKIADAIRSYE